MKKIHLFAVSGFALLIFLANAWGAFEVQELGWLDLSFKLRGPQKPYPEIVIVEIDDTSIDRIGHWPWPRGYHAALLEILRSYEPRIIFYDVLFTEASPQPEEDELLVHALKKAGNVLAAFFYHSEEPFIAFFPLASFREAAYDVGFVNIEADADARIRRIRREIKGPYYHSSVRTVLAQIPAEEQRAWLDSTPLDSQGKFWINFPGPYSVFPRIPFHKLMETAGTRDPELGKQLKDKIVLVGQTATGAGDFRPTPFSPAYAGVGIQAASLHTLLTGKFLHRLNAPALAFLLLIFCPLVNFLTRKVSPLRGLGFAEGMTALYLVAGFLAFRFAGWILPAVPVVFAILGTYVLTLLFEFIEVRFRGQLLSHELALAARIQESFLPAESPSIDGVDLGFQCRFAKEVGGDLYDWIQLGPRKLGVCVGDVSGKGVPASLYMAKGLSEWRSLVKGDLSASQLMNLLNDRLARGGTAGVFLTLLYLIVDLDSKKVTFCNAGHEPALLIRSSSGKEAWVGKAGAQPLGLFEGLSYPEEEVKIQSGDSLLLISDGVRELRNSKREEFGRERIAQAMAASRNGKTAPETIGSLFKVMDDYAGGLPAHDDRTLVVLQIK